ncbi:hypothetical protein AQUCO_01700580v1 [Aquilegia coerulea]|uniref:MADS-box domain-containing protein n=1 Tax=Aquilegia coerulea TaxID=218851 RepID=A0A2G5DNP1_AQUCA|nr:hypothetical protein AQUCO_01700580v1 [Aquilegia coerulea]
MVRGCGKLKLQLIREDSVRKATFKRRYNGLKKKIHELSTLCGVDACMITYGPMQCDGTMKLDTWPPNQEQVQQVINRYQQLDGTTKKKKNNVCLTDFMKGQNKKIEEDFSKLCEKNNENWINCLSKDQLIEISATLDSKIQTIDDKIKLIEGNQGSQEEQTKLIEYPHGLQGQAQYDLVPMQKQVEFEYPSLMNGKEQPMVIAPSNLYVGTTAMQMTNEEFLPCAAPLTYPMMSMKNSDFMDLYDLPNMNYAPLMMNPCPMTTDPVNLMNDYGFNNYYANSSGEMYFCSDPGASTSWLPSNMQSEPHFSSYPPYMMSAS